MKALDPLLDKPVYAATIIGLFLLGFAGLIGGYLYIQEHFPSEMTDIGIIFVVVAFCLLTWVSLSSLRFHSVLGELKLLANELQRRIRSHGNEAVHKDTQSAVQRFDDLAYFEESSSTIRFFPRALHLDTRYALERIPAVFQVGIQHIPALLTALGIFFTFVGLIVGIEELDLQRSADGLMEGMTTLLGGVGLAFFSSLGGILLSFIVLIATRVQLSRADSITGEISQLTARLESKQQQDPATVLRQMRKDTHLTENTMRQVLDVSREQSTKMGQLASDLATELSGALQNTIGETIGEPLEEMNKQMKSFQRKGLATHRKTLGVILNDFLEEFRSSMGDQFSQLDATLEKTLQWHAETRQTLNTLIADMREERSKQAALLNRREEFETKRLQEQIEFHENRSEHLRTFFKETRRFHEERLKQQQEVHKKQIEEQRQLFDKHRKLLKTQSQVQETALRSLFQSIEEFHEERLKKERDLMSTQVELQRELFNTHHQFWNEFSQEHQNTLRSLFQNAEEFHEERLEDEKNLHSVRMEKQQLLLDAREQLYEQQVKAHQEALDSLGHTADKINKSTAMLGESHQELTGLLRSSIELSKKLGDQLSTTIDEQWEQLMKLQTTLERMEKVTEEMPREYKALLAQMQDELRTGLGETFELFDQSTAEIVEHLSGSYVRMEGTLQKLSDEVSRLPDISSAQRKTNGETSIGNTAQHASPVSE